MIWLPLLLASILTAGPAELTDQIMARWNQPDSPGCAIGVFESGKAVLAKGYGQANLEHGIPITPQSAFYLGSTSKEFTALTIMHLIQQGRIKLDDPIHRWLPRLPEYMKAVTIRHLLEHSSGIRDYVGLWALSGPAEDAPLTTNQVLDSIHRQTRLNFAPGTEFLYSNSGYFLLGLALAPAARRPLESLATEVIFQPLGLRNTLFYEDRFRLLPKRATGYSPSGSGFRINSATIDVIGDGGVFTTLDDTLRWLSILATPPSEPVAQALALMRTPAALNAGGVAEYGRGLMLKPFRGTQVQSHAGGLRGYRSEILWIPSAKLGVACLCNRSDINVAQLARQIANAWLPAYTPPAPAKLTAADLKRKAGVFRDLDSGDLLILEPTADGLTARFHGGQFAITPETPLRFRTWNGPIDFELQFKPNGAQDDPVFLRVESEMHRNARFERVPPPPTQMDNPAQYQGQYASVEAQATLFIRFWESRLTLEQKDTPIGELQPTGPDRFAFSTMNLEFLRDANKKVTGFRLNTGRLRGLTFQYEGELP